MLKKLFSKKCTIVYVGDGSRVPTDNELTAFEERIKNGGTIVTNFPVTVITL